MSDFKLTWHGDEILKRLDKETPDALFAVAEELIGVAAAKAPRDTGTLAESGYVTMEGKSTYKAGKRHRKEIKAKKGEVIGAFAAYYGGFVEYGTSKRGAKPFLRPAVDEYRNKLGDKVAIRLRGRLGANK